MKDIDGYVTKDELYRLISNIKQNPDIVVDDKTCSTIVEAISNMPKRDMLPMQWVGCKDKLPDEGERVLIYAPKTQNQYYVATFYTLRDEIKFAMNIYGMNYCWYSEDVAYWQPLPEPPQN